MPGMWDTHSHLFLTSQTTRAVSGSCRGHHHGPGTSLPTPTWPCRSGSFGGRNPRGSAPGARLGFIEGPGRWAGPTEAIAGTEEQALGWIARYDSMGYKQIKLYNLIQQDLVPAIAREAHRRGMRLSGHVPRGLSTPAAVRLGFDEINHIAFLLSTFLSRFALSAGYAGVFGRVFGGGALFQCRQPGIRRHACAVQAAGHRHRPNSQFVAVGARPGGTPPPNVGIPAPASDSLAQRADATFLRSSSGSTTLASRSCPARTGAATTPSWRITSGPASAAQVLRIATIVPAQVMKDDGQYGSIVPGKVADLIIVDGKPAERVADLRRVERVIRAGRVYESKTLRAAVGGGR